MVPPLAPSCTDQVTAVDWEDRVPLTTAVKVAVAPVLSEVTEGTIRTRMPRHRTSTVTVAVRRASAVLAATTWNVPSAAGVM